MYLDVCHQIYRCNVTQVRDVFAEGPGQLKLASKRQNLALKHIIGVVIDY